MTSIAHSAGEVKSGTPHPQPTAPDGDCAICGFLAIDGRQLTVTQDGETLCLNCDALTSLPPASLSPTSLVPASLSPGVPYPIDPAPIPSSPNTPPSVPLRLSPLPIPSRDEKVCKPCGHGMRLGPCSASPANTSGNEVLPLTKEHANGYANGITLERVALVEQSTGRTFQNPGAAPSILAKVPLERLTNSIKRALKDAQTKGYTHIPELSWIVADLEYTGATLPDNKQPHHNGQPNGRAEALAETKSRVLRELEVMTQNGTEGSGLRRVGRNGRNHG